MNKWGDISKADIYSEMVCTPQKPNRVGRSQALRQKEKVQSCILTTYELDDLSKFLKLSKPQVCS